MKRAIQPVPQAQRRGRSVVFGLDTWARSLRRHSDTILRTHPVRLHRRAEPIPEHVASQPNRGLHAAATLPVVSAHA